MEGDVYQKQCHNARNKHSHNIYKTNANKPQSKNRISMVVYTGGICANENKNDCVSTQFPHAKDVRLSSKSDAAGVKKD